MRLPYFLGTNYKSDFISIAWNFQESEQNYNIYVKDWMKPIPLSFSSYNELERERKQNQLNDSPTEWQKFFLVTKSLSLSQSSFNVLKGLFLRWSLPQVMILFEKLSKTVDPTTYQEILSGIKGKGDQNQE